jgi:hypothetical protein
VGSIFVNVGRKMSSSLFSSQLPMSSPSERHIVNCLLARYRITPESQPQLRWQLLQAAHVAGQLQFTVHWHVHAVMLAHAWQQRDGREIRGQLLRLAGVPLAHLVRRVPVGNTGGADVSAIKPMQVPPQIAAHIAWAKSHEQA